MPDSSTILLVDDEDAVQKLLTYPLERDGFRVLQARDGAEALQLFGGERVDLVVLDLMLPKLDGLEVCKRLRAGSDVPIIMLTARGSEADRVAGLELGADDYVVKPFSAREVMARVRAVLRRVAPGPSGAGDGPIRIGEVSLDTSRHEARLGDRPLDLSRKEFELLRVLMESAGSVLTREALIEEVWDMNWFGSTKTLDVHISGLRKKLDDDPADARYIHTVRGVGFRFSGADEA
jgi:two-component system, OmpR family, response regulator RegX3